MIVAERIVAEIGSKAAAVIQMQISLRPIFRRDLFTANQLGDLVVGLLAEQPDDDGAGPHDAQIVEQARPGPGDRRVGLYSRVLHRLRRLDKIELISEPVQIHNNTLPKLGSTSAQTVAR
jgi:hypothetical protein